MEKEQQKEWAEVQKIPVSVDLVEAAKQHLKFLAAVDRNRHLYEDHALQWAIYRYNAFWLPLLAKHLENPVSNGPLVVPLDCEWIWHCHRLNPIRYRFDCQKLYGRILGNRNVMSSVQATSKGKSEEVWNKMYPEEPYELDTNRSFSEDLLRNEKFTDYDLLSGVKRQMSFTYQVSRPYMSDDLFLQEAVARYKGFLHLIRKNKEMGIENFCVPTYEVDLMWHTHQLYPYNYCMDMIKILGVVLQHNDSDSDTSKGSRLDNGFSDTTRQWEDVFGKSYWKAGVMKRGGNAPTPVTNVPFKFRYEGKQIRSVESFDNGIQFSSRKAVEVCMEFKEIKNLPEDYKDNIFVSFSKKQSDKLFNFKRSLSVFSESGEKQVAHFQCESTGEFIFELISSNKALGFCSLSLQELLASQSEFSSNKWLLVNPSSDVKILDPVQLHVSVSFTPPTPVPQVFHLKHSQDWGTSLKTGKVNQATIYKDVVDDDGNRLFSLQMRNTVKDTTENNPGLLKEVYYITGSGEKHQVAEEAVGGNWVVKGKHGELYILQNNSDEDDYLFQLVGNKMVKFFSGRRLDFEPKNSASNRSEKDFITGVEFSEDHPYGRAIALFDLKFGIVKAQDEWIVVPGIVSGLILAKIGGHGFTDSCATYGGGELCDHANVKFGGPCCRSMCDQHKDDVKFGGGGGLGDHANVEFGGPCCRSMCDQHKDDVMLGGGASLGYHANVEFGGPCCRSMCDQHKDDVMLGGGGGLGDHANVEFGGPCCRSMCDQHKDDVMLGGGGGLGDHANVEFGGPYYMSMCDKHKDDLMFGGGPCYMSMCDQHKDDSMFSGGPCYMSTFGGGPCYMSICDQHKDDSMFSGGPYYMSTFGGGPCYMSMCDQHKDDSMFSGGPCYMSTFGGGPCYMSMCDQHKDDLMFGGGPCYMSMFGGGPCYMSMRDQHKDDLMFGGGPCYMSMFSGGPCYMSMCDQPKDDVMFGGDAIVTPKAIAA